MSRYYIFLSLLVIALSARADKPETFLDCESYIKVPLTRLSTGHDTLELHINGKKGRFVLDTGATTIINSERQRYFGVSRDTDRQPVEATGAAGPININLVNVNDVRIGNQDLAISTVAMTDLSAITQALGNSTGVWLDGLVGMDVLTAHQGVIDAGRGVLILQSEAVPQQRVSEMTLYGFKSIQLEPVHDGEYDLSHHLVNVRINGVQTSLLLDSGSGRTMVDQAAGQRLGLGRDTRIGFRQSAGAGRAFGQQIHQVDNLTIASQPITINSLAMGDLSSVVKFIQEKTGRHIDGVLGQDVLNQHQAVIDVTSHRLYLK